MADVATVLHGGVGMLWQPGGVHTLVQVGLGGAAIGVVGLFTQSPLTPPPTA